MKLTWKNPETPYKGLYPNAVMRFERSHNDAVNKVKTFTFKIYPSENHYDHVAVGSLTFAFDEANQSTTILNDGVSQFKFNSDFSGFVTLENAPYQPVAQPTVDFMGVPSYDEVFHFIEESGNGINFKDVFGISWLYMQPFEGSFIGLNWEVV
jgi:predicted 3-demethylubiquinone-9 3-methyltransferase (glyoxalase superfamily)